MPKETLTREEFIKRVQSLHGDRFDFSKLEYKNYISKICLIDKEFGNTELWTTPRRVLGCKVITHPMKTFEEFVFLAEKINPEKYDYTPTKDIFNKFKFSERSTKKVPVLEKSTNKIIYKKVRDLTQGDEKETLRKQAFESFLKDAFNLYGNKFEYSEAEWINKSRKIKILCKIHNEYFYETPYNHLKGTKGCKICQQEKLFTVPDKPKTITFEIFLEKAKKIHGDKYDYSFVNFIDMKTKIDIFCKKHNSFFKQTPANHIYIVLFVD